MGAAISSRPGTRAFLTFTSMCAFVCVGSTQLRDLNWGTIGSQTDAPGECTWGQVRSCSRSHPTNRCAFGTRVSLIETAIWGQAQSFSRPPAPNR